MLRSTFFASLLLATACIDDTTMTDASAVEAGGDGKADSVASVAEHKVLDESRQPEHVMQDATHVYYTLFTEQDEANQPQTRSVMRVRRSDGNVEQIATITGYPYYAALGGGFIYFADYDRVYKLPKAGGIAQLVAPIEGTTALAADSSGVYLAASAVEGDRYFHRISKIAAGSTTPVELGRATYVTDIAVDDTHVYWLDETQPNPAIGCGRNAGLVRKVSKLRGFTITLAAGINCPLVLALDNTSIYYTNWAMTDGGNPVIKLGKNGGFPKLLGRTGNWQLAVDPTYVYWISTDGDLVRTTKTIPLARAIADDVHVIVGADAAGVYFWREQDEPRLYSLYRIGQ
jgi:hypothetical protein